MPLTRQDAFGPNVEIEVDENGDERYYYRLQVGGRDKNGLYELILEGPAEGEKYYHESI